MAAAGGLAAPRQPRRPMTLYSSPTLRDWTLPMVRLACDRCDRRGQYLRETLIAKHGLEVTMPDLRHLIAQCPRHGAPGQACGVYYADLKPDRCEQA